MQLSLPCSISMDCAICCISARLEYFWYLLCILIWICKSIHVFKNDLIVPQVERCPGNSTVYYITLTLEWKTETAIKHLTCGLNSSATVLKITLWIPINCQEDSISFFNMPLNPLEETRIHTTPPLQDDTPSFTTLRCIVLLRSAHVYSCA